MRSRLKFPRSKPSRRPGLAPLELVLSLPLLLFVMALMINFGAAACWKVRAAGAARDAVWRARTGWNGGSDPHPPNWPLTATMGVANAANLTSIDQAWNVPAINHPFTHGPIISVPNNPGPYIQVFQGKIYAMADSVQRGEAYIQRNFPLLQSLGQYYFNPHHPLLDSRWTFQNMNYGWNDSQRTKGWYNWESRPEWASQLALFQRADGQLRNYALRENLVPLDRDPEFPAFYGGRPPDFYPSPGGACTFDRERVRATIIENRGGLLDDIQGPNAGGKFGVPWNMANRYIKLYQDEIQQLQQQMPPPMAQIQALEQLIEQLNDFKATLN